MNKNNKIVKEIKKKQRCKHKYEIRKTKYNNIDKKKEKSIMN